jgi:hypothetical protein
MIKIQPITLWIDGSTEASYINIDNGVYNFLDGTLSVKYAIHNDGPQLSGGEVIVPSDIVSGWVDDSTIVNWVINKLGLLVVEA